MGLRTLFFPLFVPRFELRHSGLVASPFTHRIILTAPFFFLILRSQYCIPREIIKIQIEIALTLFQKTFNIPSRDSRLGYWHLAGWSGSSLTEAIDGFGLVHCLWSAVSLDVPRVVPCSSQLSLEVNSANFRFFNFLLHLKIINIFFCFSYSLLTACLCSLTLSPI